MADIDYSCDPGGIHRHLMAMMLINDMKVERRIRSFLDRTGLPLSEVVLVQLRGGGRFPQWKGALREIPPCSEVSQED